MLLPDLTSIRASDPTLTGIGQNTDNKTTFDLTLNHTNDADRVQSSIFQSTGLTGLYTEQGTMASSFSAMQSAKTAFTSTRTGLVQTAISAYQGIETGETVSTVTFPLPLTATGQTGLMASAGLFGMQFVPAGGMLDLTV